MIDEYVRTRKSKRYERECRGIPAGLIDLMSVPGLGQKLSLNCTQNSTSVLWRI